MKLFKNISAWVQAKIDKYVLKRFVTILPKDLIKSLYKQVAESELQITTKVVEVKKGKRKYVLFVVKDKNLQTVFNLGRHEENAKDYPTVQYRGEFTNDTIAEMQREQREKLMADNEEIDISTKDYSFETGV